MSAVGDETTRLFGEDEQNRHGGNKRNASRSLRIPGPKTRAYHRRWWVMAVFCSVGCNQSMVWNTWSPVAESAELALGWSDGNVASAVNLSNISYLIFVIPVCMYMDTKGLRIATILGTLLVAVGAASRCFSLEYSAITSTSYLCAIADGIGASVPFSGPALLAAIWFPVHQRPLATAFASFFNYFGVSLSFVVGPAFVPDPYYSWSAANLSDVETSANNKSDRIVTNMEEIKSGIRNLLYFYAALAVLSLGFVLVYFPAKPPTPPSITASVNRISYKQAMMQILCNRSLWLVVVAGAMPIGIVGTWIAILDVVVKPIGVTQIDAGWIGFWHTLIGCFSGILIAKFADLFHRRRKVFLMILFSGAAVFAVWFALVTNGTIPYSVAQLYAAGILLGVCVNGTTPLFYEMCAEASYPVAEGVTGGLFTAVNCVFGIVFLSLLSVPGIGTQWMTWAAVASVAAAVPLMCLFPERYNRSDIDMHIASKDVDNVVF
ncbi:solute carrier family 49 member 4 homolog [Dreissena polymorpha]|uniref:Uncharacterized protein n=1 Tax=Dreissena polymorpha TaxID=45954 RepID=A0A9D4IL49_DREPO|nr:solute carrier family 49 member 4 homolog [Dreissena polymorpha]KAH3776944.1 hypothetical protein DPMN_178378 [Dreissena polymorpha]